MSVSTGRITAHSIAEWRMELTRLRDLDCLCVKCTACDGQKFAWESDPVCDYLPCSTCNGTGVTTSCERCVAIRTAERELVIEEAAYREVEDDRTERDRRIFEQWLPVLTGESMGRGADVSRWDDGKGDYRNHTVRVAWIAWQRGQFSPHRSPTWDLGKVHAQTLSRERWQIPGPFLHGDVGPDGELVCARCSDPLPKAFLDEIASDALQLRRRWKELMAQLDSDIQKAVETTAAAEIERLETIAADPQGALF